MKIHAQHIAKYVVYSLGLVATIATSPAYNFYGAMGFDVQTIDITASSGFFSLTAIASTIDNLLSPCPFQNVVGSLC